MLDLSALDEFVTDKQKEPTALETLYYAFWERGITLEEIERLPIPYIIGVMNTLKYVREKEEQESKKK
jgi:hypothetical protein